MKNKYELIFEKCHHCETEVELSTEFKMHPCPNCRKRIKLCALCDLDLGNCEECPL